MKKTIFIFIMVFFSGMYIFSSKRKHLLLSLLSLEYIALGLFFFIFFSYLSSSFFISLVFITFAACEGALGLSLLVSMSRTFGADYFSVFSFY